MKVTDTLIPDVKFIEPRIFSDERGFLFERFALKDLQRALNTKLNIIQQNQVFSHKNVLRGLHFQDAHMAMGKLVSVVRGEIFDVAVDIRVNSPSFGEWVGVYLSAENHRQMWIPGGFAHGYLTTQDETIVTYGMTNYYDPANEQAILWNDKMLNINWPLERKPIISARDRDEAKSFASHRDRLLSEVSTPPKTASLAKSDVPKKVSYDNSYSFSKALSPSFINTVNGAMVVFGGVLKNDFRSSIYAGELKLNSNFGNPEITNIKKIHTPLPLDRKHDGICPSHIFATGEAVFMQTASFVVNKTAGSLVETEPYQIQADHFELDLTLANAQHISPILFFDDSPHQFECGATFDVENSTQYFVHGTKFIFDRSQNKYVPNYKLYRQRKDGFKNGKIEPVLDDMFYNVYFGLSRVTFYKNFGYFAARKLGTPEKTDTDIYRIELSANGTQVPQKVYELAGLNFPQLFDYSGIYSALALWVTWEMGE